MRSNAGKIDALLRKWLALLPHPFTPQDRAAGFRYDLSIVQAEFARTQVLDRPVAGRIFIEEVIRENLELGRPDNVQLIFERRVTKRTPGRFRTRVVTEGVLPSLYIDYKSSRIKQYFKEGQALRTETTINDSYDFGIGRRLENLSALRELGFTANRRLLDVQRASQDCRVGEDVFREVTLPRQVNTQRASAGAKARRQRAPTAPPPPAAPAPRATTVNPSPCSAMERRQPAGLMALIPITARPLRGRILTRRPPMARSPIPRAFIVHNPQRLPVMGLRPIRHPATTRSHTHRRPTVPRPMQPPIMPFSLQRLLGLVNRRRFSTVRPICGRDFGASDRSKTLAARALAAVLETARRVVASPFSALVPYLTNRRLDQRTKSRNGHLRRRRGNERFQHGQRSEYYARRRCPG